MRPFFIVLALQPLLTISILLTRSNSLAWSTDWLITNCPEAYTTGTTELVPYQYIEVLDYRSGLMRMKYNLTGEAQNVIIIGF